jgi:hypothetical protein
MNTESSSSQYVIRIPNSLLHRWEFLDITTGKTIPDPENLPMYFTEDFAKKVVKDAQAGGAKVGGAVSLEQALRELNEYVN